MSYQPNLKDPRVHNRIRRAYGFAQGILSAETPHAWSSRYIDRYFGQQQNTLSNWLRNHLLICTDNHYNKDAGITKKYLLNTTGARYIRAVLSGTDVTLEEFVSEQPTTELDVLLEPSQRQFDQQVVAHWMLKEFGSELESLTFNYDDKSNRLWHPMQSIKRIYKKPLLAEHGLRYHYDIQCAAPTLIHQHAQQQTDPMDLYLFALRRYLADRNNIRNELARAVDIDVKTAKVIINALFCGARLGNNPDFALSQLLSNDSARIEYLKQDPFISELREDIKTCWTYIMPSMMRRSITDKNNRERMLPINSREKWTRYFQLERLVLNSVIDYMRTNSMSYFLEHDGWACSHQIDLDDLSEFVWNTTGYRVQFESESINTKFERTHSLRELVE